MKKNENEIEELQEWQSKQYSPGHFIGTGKVPKPIMGLTRFPIILISLGSFFLIFALFSLFFKVYGFFLVGIFFSFAFLYGGIFRIVNKKKYKKHLR